MDVQWTWHQEATSLDEPSSSASSIARYCRARAEAGEQPQVIRKEEVDSVGDRLESHFRHFEEPGAFQVWNARPGESRRDRAGRRTKRGGPSPRSWGTFPSRSGAFPPGSESFAPASGAFPPSSETFPPVSKCARRHSSRAGNLPEPAPNHSRGEGEHLARGRSPRVGDHSDLGADGSRSGGNDAEPGSGGAEAHGSHRRMCLNARRAQPNVPEPAPDVTRARAKAPRRSCGRP